MASKTICETELTLYKQECKGEFVTSRSKAIRLHHGNLTKDQLSRWRPRKYSFLENIQPVGLAHANMQIVKCSYKKLENEF